MNTLCTFPAHHLARLIAAGEVSSQEAVEAHIDRIEAVNPSLRAVVVTRYEEARREAAAADRHRQAGRAMGPLGGVPVTVKECLDLTGSAATFGIPSRAQVLAARDDRYVARWREAGAVVLAKTNVAQLLLYFESDNPLYGRTQNPWDPARTCGGSSGGEGAIIAAGGSPMGLGTDLGGSCRIPAAFCGICGFKPTAGRLPDDGRFSIPIGQQAVVSQVGVLAREIADLALGLDIANGGRLPAVEPALALGDYRTVDASRLRVAWHTDDGTLPVAPAARRAVHRAVAALEGAGAAVIPWTPPDVEPALALIYGLLSADGFRGAQRVLGDAPRDPRIALLETAASASPFKLWLLRQVLTLSGRAQAAQVLRYYGRHDADAYWQLVESQIEYRQRFGAALDAAPGGPIDLIVAPACALPAVPHGATRELGLIGGYTCLYNVLGYPAGVVPVTRVRPGEESDRRPDADRLVVAARDAERGSAGLPIGVQVIARPWRDHVALAAMAVIEAAVRAEADYPITPITPVADPS